MRPNRFAPLMAGLLLATGPSDGTATKFAGEWLNQGGGARALALGGAYTAVASDASAVFWNPAGLAALPGSDQGRRRQILLMHSERFGDLVDYNFGAYRQLLHRGETAAIGAALVHQGISDIVLTSSGVVFNDDGDGVVEPGELIYNKDDLERDSHHDVGLFLTYADVWRGVRWGGNLKLIRTWSVEDYSCYGFGLDVGLLADDVWKNLDLGLKVQDLTGTYLSWSTGEEEYIAPSTRLGLAYDLPVEPLRGSFLFTLDGEFHFESRRHEATQFWVGAASADFHYGGEFSFRDRGAVRVGMDTDFFTAGAGFLLGPVGLDYAFLDHDDLDATHRVSLSVDF
jgi:hypothetical protein